MNHSEELNIDWTKISLERLKHLKEEIQWGIDDKEKGFPKMVKSFNGYKEGNLLINMNHKIEYIDMIRQTSKESAIITLRDKYQFRVTKQYNIDELHYEKNTLIVLKQHAKQIKEEKIALNKQKKDLEFNELLLIATIDKLERE